MESTQDDEPNEKITIISGTSKYLAPQSERHTVREDHPPTSSGSKNIAQDFTPSEAHRPLVHPTIQPSHSMPLQHIPYNMASTDHEMPNNILIYHRPQPLEALAHYSPPAYVYPIAYHPHSPPDPRYGAAHGYSPVLQHQHAPYYGDAHSIPVPPYLPGGPVPLIVSQDPYLPRPTSFSPHRGIHSPGIAGFRSPLLVPDGGFQDSRAHTNSDESRLGRDGFVRGSRTGVKAISKYPLRKSKHSGHALWVGNLPSRVTIAALKDYFSHGFHQEIQSLFLIAKSNCAFVNYSSEADCAVAIERFHNSRFQGAQLVCRLRKSSRSNSDSLAKSPVTDEASFSLPTSSSQYHPTSETDGEFGEDVDESEVPEPNNLDNTNESVADRAIPTPERYFVMKSLTMQDLVQSVRRGSWATQRHNEAALNSAFNSAQSIYLIFSVNRSREYFGYARMSTLVPDGEPDPTDLESRTSRADVVETRVTITPATEYAPKGRIIEDLFRGTILWEAERDGEEKVAEPDGEEADTWGKPFGVAWISTKRIPFYRARGLRNRWNANKEVKVARDGTEIEPEVGRQLVQLFHRTNPAPPLAAPMGSYPLIVRDHGVP